MMIESERKKNTRSYLERRTKRRKLLIAFVFVAIVIFITLLGFVVLIYVKVVRFEGAVRSLQERTERRKHFHKYLMIQKDSEKSLSFESTKEINEFSLYPTEHGVSVHPILFDHERGYEISLFEGKSLYLCTCDLEELKEEIELMDPVYEDLYRRSVTSEEPSIRRNVVVSSGFIIVSAISMLMVMWKSEVVTLQIFANNEIEAIEYASDELSSRILSEVDSSSSSNSNNFDSYVDDEEFDEEKEAKLRELMEENRMKDEYIADLKRKIGKLTGCNEAEEEVLERKSEESEQIVQSQITYCQVQCTYQPKDHPTIDSGFVDCIVLSDWIGNQKLYGFSDDKSLSKEALQMLCNEYAGDGTGELSNLSFECFPNEIKQTIVMDQSKLQKVYLTPESCSSSDLDDFIDHIDESYDRTPSCYSYLEHMRTV